MDYIFTMKCLAKTTEIGKYSIAVVDEHGFTTAILGHNIDINTACAIELWFNFHALPNGKTLMRFLTDKDGIHYTQNLFIDSNGEWERLGY